MKIYFVDAEDLMNSTWSNNRTTIGYFVDRNKAERARDKYNNNLSPRLRATSFQASISDIEVEE